MRYKYIEERYPRWYNLGDTVMAYSTPREFSDGTVLNEKFIREHNDTVEKLCEAVCMLFDLDEEKASEWWYESNTEKEK